MTALRKQLLTIFAAHNGPLAVADLLAMLAQAGLKVNKTTVYRELDFLIAKCLVTELDFGEGKKRYETANLEHHHHLICVKCNTIDEVHLEDELSEEEKRIWEKKKFKVTRHALEFFGVCGACQ